ncbi:DUF3466 family protein [Shewanella gelidimarina]|uniref:DUF3466 family protein n=1 Tax=Shewanella gelidimarina TaxID=56813 RepID=UPI00200BF756|nr:DUF3466 family protein [Shewanella gelidimarina]MCL1058166.1 DUF3466 family protein [Shewanella gelidimarina]
MKFKLEKTLSLVAVGVLSVLQGAQAAPVYEIKNIDADTFNLNGTIENTRNGYGMSVNNNNEAVGAAKGKKKLNVDEDDDGVIDIEDGVSDAETITYSVNLPILANNFTFTSIENDATTPWLPTFESVNGTTAPTFPEVDPVNSVDTFYYGINDAKVKVGEMTAAEQKVDYSGSSTTQEYWYYRDYEQRGFVKDDTNTEIPLVPPYIEYVSKQDSGDVTVNVGGFSSATAVNSANMVTGYASTDISKNSASIIDSCVSNKSDTAPIDICVQNRQYPNTNGFRDIQYQTRGYVWRYEAGTIAEALLLPLGLETTNDNVYTGQGLGINTDGVVAGRSHVYRKGDTDRLAFDAAYWTKGADGSYQYNWVDVDTVKDVRSSIAYDINDNGILVGSYNKYIEGYPRDKFFYMDTSDANAELITPFDLYNNVSDLSSRGRDINNNGQVVGYIETTHDKEKPRPKAGFLYDIAKDEFTNLNELLTCESKGFEKDPDTDKWIRHEVKLTDGTGVEVTYDSEIIIVEANSINDSGTIVGTAFIRKPSYKFDTDGNLVLGDNGKPIFELRADGDAVTAFLPRMMVLQTSGAEVTDEWKAANNCIDESGESGDYERKGAASLGWLLMLPLVWLRRRRK